MEAKAFVQPEFAVIQNGDAVCQPRYYKGFTYHNNLFFFYLKLNNIFIFVCPLLPA